MSAVGRPASGSYEWLFLFALTFSWQQLDAFVISFQSLANSPMAPLLLIVIIIIVQWYWWWCWCWSWPPMNIFPVVAFHQRKQFKSHFQPKWNLKQKQRSSAIRIEFKWFADVFFIIPIYYYTLHHISHLSFSLFLHVRFNRCGWILWGFSLNSFGGTVPEMERWRSRPKSGHWDTTLIIIILQKF